MIDRLGKQWMNSILIASIVVGFYFIIDLKILSGHDWNARAFVMERPEGVSLDRGWGIGYDGQFSYALATNPLGSIEDLDQPAYRYQRILHPLLVRIVSLGKIEFVPWVILGLNLFFTVVCCVALGLLLSMRGASPWWSLVFVFSLGYLLTMRMDLLEPMAIGFALSGWLFYEKKKLIPAILLFAMSGLTKEVGLVFPFALAIWELTRRNLVRGVGLILGSFAPYIIWYLILLNWLGTTQIQIAQSTPMLIPFYGLQYLEDPINKFIVVLWVVLPAILGGMWVIVDVWRNGFGEWGQDAIMVIANVVFIAALPLLSWGDPLAILRLGLGLLAAILVWLASHNHRFLIYAAALWGPSGLLLLLVPGMM